MGEYPFAIQGSYDEAVADYIFPGYPMAKNLREKINKDDTMVINDVNAAATQQFVKEVGGNVTIAKTVREVAEQTVRATLNRGRDESLAFVHPLSKDVKIVLSMILSAMLHSDYILTIHKI
jgi:hypothetical protein